MPRFWSEQRAAAAERLPRRLDKGHDSGDTIWAVTVPAVYSSRALSAACGVAARRLDFQAPVELRRGEASAGAGSDRRIRKTLETIPSGFGPVSESGR